MYISRPSVAPLVGLGSCMVRSVMAHYRAAKGVRFRACEVGEGDTTTHFGQKQCLLAICVGTYLHSHPCHRMCLPYPTSGMDGWTCEFEEIAARSLRARMTSGKALASAGRYWRRRMCQGQHWHRQQTVPPKPTAAMKTTAEDKAWPRKNRWW